MSEKSQNQTDPVLNDPKIKLCFQLIHNKKFSDAQHLIADQIAEAKLEQNPEKEGIYYTVMGVLLRAQKQIKPAYKFYQKAEKCLPDDFSIKLLNARFLIDEFHQYETALRKLDKILQQVDDDIVLQHQAKALKSIAAFQLGKKKMAEDLLQDLVAEDFTQFKTATNLDFKACEFFLKKNFAKDLCLAYLKKSLDLAKSARETPLVKVLQQLLDIFS